MSAPDHAQYNLGQR